MNATPEDRPIRSMKPGALLGALKAFDAKHVVTPGEFFIDVPGLGKDMDWNHMDQMHRPSVHQTYQSNLRIALGRDFAVSLTRFGHWPFLITVTDTRISEGVFYQDFVLAGMFYIHNTITMQEQPGEMVRMKVAWLISSHWLFKPLHRVLDHMFRKLNARLQEEDSVIRRQRYHLRKEGYCFRSDPPDYYSSNQLTYNTVYPPLADGACIDTSQLPLGVVMACKAGGVEFLVRREAGEVQLWPAACPHEGGELIKGKPHEDCRIECPWHGLKISGVQLSASQPAAQNYGFSYALDEYTVHIRTTKI